MGIKIGKSLQEAIDNSGDERLQRNAEKLNGVVKKHRRDTLTVLKETLEKLKADGIMDQEKIEEMENSIKELEAKQNN